MRDEFNLEIKIPWKEVNALSISGFRESNAIFIALFVIIGASFFLGWYPLPGLIIIYAIFGTLFAYNISAMIKKRMYEYVSEMSIGDDRIVYRTVGNKTFTIYWENIGLFIDVDGFGTQYRINYRPPYFIIVYYNEEHKKCFKIVIDKKTGRELLKRYNEYLTKLKTKKCPIVGGIIPNSNPIIESINKIMSSSFCKRERLKNRTKVPPPPWLKEGGK